MWHYWMFILLLLYVIIGETTVLLQGSKLQSAWDKAVVCVTWPYYLATKKVLFTTTTPPTTKQ